MPRSSALFTAVLLMISGPHLGTAASEHEPRMTSWVICMGQLMLRHTLRATAARLALAGMPTDRSGAA